MSDEYYAQSFDNSNVLENNTFMIKRIDTEPLLKRVENFLTGRRKILIDDGNGLFKEEWRKFGEPLANSDGINSIMNKMFCLLNSQIVQGNITIDMYYDIISELRQDFATELMYNSQEWGIDDNKLDFIADTILLLVEGFLTRLINNKEREGYEKSVISRELISPDYANKKKMLLGGSN